MIKHDFFVSQPGEGSRYIVGRHTAELVEMIHKDAADFSLKTQLKEKCLCQLYNLIYCIEDGIKPYTEKILKHIIYKLILDEEIEI